MADCGVCIGGGDFDSSWSFSNSRIIKARKDHKCYECGRPINKGGMYHYFSGLCEGDFSDYHTCLDCHNIRIGLTCEDGLWPYFGDLWNDIIQNFPHLKSTACLTKISTASAKAYFLQRWRQWKGLEQYTNKTF